MFFLHLILLISTVVLLKNEINQMFKEPLVMVNDCLTVQRSARAMSLRVLNFWTVYTVTISLLYFLGIQIVGALPSKVLYIAAFCHLLTTFFDYSFMAGFRDCDDFDFLRWRVDAYLRSAVYIWIVSGILRNFSAQPLLLALN
jgi:hypothetical protein